MLWVTSWERTVTPEPSASLQPLRCCHHLVNVCDCTNLACPTCVDLFLAFDWLSCLACPVIHLIFSNFMHSFFMYSFYYLNCPVKEFYAMHYINKRFFVFVFNIYIITAKLQLQVNMLSSASQQTLWLCHPPEVISAKPTRAWTVCFNVNTTKIRRSCTKEQVHYIEN